MINKKLDQEILSYIRKDNSTKLIAQRTTVDVLKRKGYYDYLIQRYSDNTTDTLREILYRLNNNIETAPTCKMCGKPIVFNVGNVMYSKYCCRTCQNNDPEIKKKNSESVSKALKEAYKDRGEEIKTKRSKTLSKKYGENIECSSPFAYKEVNKKIRNAILEKYGVENVFALEEFRGNTKERFREKSVDLWKSRGMDISYTDHDTIIVKNACPIHGDSEISVYYFNKRTRGKIANPRNYCLKCFPINMYTSSELLMKEFLESQNLNIKTNTHSIIPPFELDFYLPDYSLAIEYDGIYFHSEDASTANDYHKNKSDMCDSKNIQLIHIWEDQWKSKFDAVKSSILLLLGKNEVYSGDYEFKLVDNNIAKKFIEENSLYNFIDTTANVVMYDKLTNDIIKIMCISKTSFGLCINNIATKIWMDTDHTKHINNDMLKYAVNNVNELKNEFNIYALSNRDFYYQKEYEELGLNKKTVDEPTYSWRNEFYCIPTSYTISTAVFDKHVPMREYKCYNSGNIIWTK